MPNPPADITATIARYCRSAAMNVLEPEVMLRTKMVLLDDLGSMAIGCTLEPGRLAHEYVRELGSTGTSTIVGDDFTAAAPLAALANGMTLHADEIDGSHTSEGHPSAIITPACLAAADHMQSSGADLLRALDLGFDVGTRLVRAAGGRARVLRGRHLHSDSAYALGAAAGAGLLLGLSTEQFAYAFALAATQITMPAAFFDEPDHISKALNCGQGANAGVSGALMAARGFTANDEVIEHRDGVLRTWTDEPDLAAAVEGLGERHSIVDANFKYYSAGYPIHFAIHAALRVLGREKLTSSDVASVSAHTTTNSARVVDGRAMASICAQDMIALAMRLGRLGVDDSHDPTRLKDPEVKRLRETIEIVGDPAIDAVDPNSRGGWIEITLFDGRSFIEHQEFPPGHCRAQDATWPVLAEKFVGLATRTVGADRATKVVKLVADLQEVDSVDTLTRLVRAPIPATATL